MNISAQTEKISKKYFGVYSRANGLLIHEKNSTWKVSCYSPLKHVQELGDKIGRIKGPDGSLDPLHVLQEFALGRREPKPNRIS